MTDLAGALAAHVLSPFEGKDVLRSAIEIPNAAGGLREAMKVEPRELHHGEKLYVVLECDVAKVRFDPIKDTDALGRVQVLHAVAATFVDEELVRNHLDEQARKIRKAKEDAAGIQSIVGDTDSEINPAVLGADDAAFEEDATIVLERQHSNGAHRDGLRPGCPLCDAEAAAVAAEALPDPTPITRPRRRAKGATKK